MEDRGENEKVEASKSLRGKEIVPQWKVIIMI
jgi:hypothetical protein